VRGRSEFFALISDRQRCHNLLADTAPIAFRQQNGGDYTIPALTLKDSLAEGESGFAVHVK